MRILLTGADGQVGQALGLVLAARHTLLLTSHTSLDISDYRSVEEVVRARPDLVIHPAAFTHVDGCALDPDKAYRVNGLGTRHMALACQRLDIPLVYLSTNEVFDGTATTPYHEWDLPHPINPYASSKWAGEQFVQQLCQKFYIVRIAWVFGGAHNFVQTVLRLADERPMLAVVQDEIGNPTYAPDLAAAVGALIQEPAYGIYHFVNEGYCSRFEFAHEILRLAGKAIDVQPITLAEYKRASTPPPFTPLRNFVGAIDLGITLRPWQEALATYLMTLAAVRRA
ncbi:MAG: dTDP-4-dehydrorhamnose reductase [Herpetosiphonaceae bacterium]|nr:dTDP-4-dehydrorhamnose reductase [Herpetosiphonaceae bacterium]